jgi:RND family efflux transporter MFP subunit
MNPVRILLIPLLLVSLTACERIKGLVGRGGDSTSVAGDLGEGGDTTSTRSNVQIPVLAEEIVEGDLVISVLANGRVQSESITPVKAEVGGLVEEITARPGERVEKGAPLVRLATEDFDFAIQRAEAGVAEATIRYEDYWRPDSIVQQRMPTQERLESARIRSGLASAELNLTEARMNKERATIRAPFSGVIDAINVNLGERISAGTAVTVLVDDVNLRIEASVLEHDLPYIRAGGTATATSPAAPNRVATGRITNVLPLVDSVSRSGRAYVRLQGNGVLRPGMYADVRLEAQRLTNRITVSNRAIIERDGRPLVFVIRDGRAQWTYIQRGRNNGLRTEVLPDTSGPSAGAIPVKVGDLVIVDGHLTLIHDAPVRVVARPEDQ